MFRKIILVVATFALVCVAFAIYVWREDSGLLQTRRALTPPPISPPATRPAGTTQPGDAKRATIAIKWANIPSGEKPKIRVYDPKTGEAKIIFQAREWDPVSDSEFHLISPSARILLPGGQLAYVQADEGQVKVQVNDDDNLDPKSGWFKGNVQITIDLTDADWRRKNPDQANLDQHPDTVVKIWMEDARFDLDLARLESDGTIRVESTRGTIEGKGLELVWSEVDRRVKLLRIVEGKRATLRGSELSEFGVIPTQAEIVKEESSDQPSHPLANMPVQITRSDEVGPEKTDRSVSLAAINKAESSSTAPANKTFTTDIKPPGEKIAFWDESKTPKPKEDRIDTYRVVFKDNIDAQQKEGSEITGRLKADTLTLLSDFGREERSRFQHIPGTQPAKNKKPARATAPAVAVKDLEAKKLQATTAPEPAGKSPKAKKPKPETTIEMVWTGEVLLEPVATRTPATQPDGAKKPKKRFHLIAEGQPVELHKVDQGSAVCRKLEYHTESKQFWLFGSAEHPAVLGSGTERQIVVEKHLFFDYSVGIARIEGAGHMSQRKSNATAAQRVLPLALKDSDDWLGDTSSDVQIAWQKSGQIEFGRAQLQAPDTDETPEGTRLTKQVDYLKRAAFDGSVSADLSGRTVSADQVEVAFIPPRWQDDAEQKNNDDDKGKLLGPVAAERVTATGHVRMMLQDDQKTKKGQRKTESVTCDALDIQMGIDDETGENVPRIGRAIGNVIARQVVQSYIGPIPTGSPQAREICAEDTLTIEMASIPKPITDEERQQWKTYAEQKGYTPDSPEWQEAQKKLEEKYRKRRDITVTKMIAVGNVTAQDEKQELEGLLAQSLECTFDRDNRISHAMIIGSADHPAHVEHGMFYIRGPLVSLNMATETVQVPGAGLLRFNSNQDIDGGPVDKPIPVEVRWDERMKLRGKENIGTFSNKVRVESENNTLEASRELRLRFAPVESQEGDTAQASSGPGQGVFRVLSDTLKPKKRKSSRDRLGIRIKKRLARVDTLGDAVIVSSAYEDVHAEKLNPVTKTVRGLIPDILKAPASQPSEQTDRRLVSRIRLAGPQMRIDLIQEQLLVEGAGNLLIEDYRISEPKRRPKGRPSALLSASNVPGLDGLGPSQTLITWENSMTFLNISNKAVFDHRVEMRHKAGSEMALAGQLEAVLNLDDATKRRLKSRAASLVCNNLVAEFERGKPRDQTGSSPLSQVAGLKGFWARGDVALVNREQSHQRSAWGSQISYDRTSGLASVAGVGRQPAVFQDVNPQTGALNAQWKGEAFDWDLKTGKIITRGSTILAPR